MSHLTRYLYDTIRRCASELGPGPDGAESGRLKDGVGAAEPDTLIPKFPSVEEIVTPRDASPP